jgi:hypothetical protein
MCRPLALWDSEAPCLPFIVVNDVGLITGAGGKNEEAQESSKVTEFLEVLSNSSLLWPGQEFISW